MASRNSSGFSNKIVRITSRPYLDKGHTTQIIDTHDATFANIITF